MVRRVLDGVLISLACVCDVGPKPRKHGAQGWKSWTLLMALGCAVVMGHAQTVPVIVTQPTNQESYLGGGASFQVAAFGTQPLYYQWRCNGVDIPGSTNSLLTLSQLTLSQEGTYSVQVSNAAGNTPSTGAALVIGPVVSWGSNDSSQNNVPPGLTNAIALATRYAHNVALKSNGTVQAWGDNTYGQCDVPAGLSNVVSVDAGETFSLALKGDGTLVGWGETLPPAGLSNIVSIAAGAWHGLALESDGTVTGWGRNDYGQASIPSALNQVVALAASDYHSLALRADGTVVGWGKNDYGQATAPNGLSNVVAIAAGFDYSLALLADGTVVGWGFNVFGGATVPAGLSNVVAIAAGGYHSLALCGNGTLVGWGDNAYGQAAPPNGLTNIVAIGAGWTHSLALFNRGLPALIRKPESRTQYSGTTAVFQLAAVGPGPLQYQWYFEGSAIHGATNTSLTLSNVQATDAGHYSVSVANSYGTMVYSNLTLTVNYSEPFITRQPADQLVFPGTSVSNATFSVAVDGSQPLNYQWFFNGDMIDGATDATLTLTNVQAGDGGAYEVWVWNEVGFAESSMAILTVGGLAEALNTTNLAWQTGGEVPWFVTTSSSHDATASARAGDVAGAQQQSTLQTTVTGPGTLTFWWSLSVYSTAYPVSLELSANGVTQARLTNGTSWRQQTCYLGAGTNTLVWTYRSSYPTAGRNVAGLDQVNFIPGGTAPFLTASPGKQTRPAGTNVTFSVTALGTPPLAYQWFYNSNSIPGATNTVLSLLNVQTNDSGFYGVLVSNAYGATNSTNALLTVTSAPPTILVQPVAPPAWPQTTVALSVSAVGSQPFSYQWRVNGTNLLNATNPVLTLANLQFSDSAAYSVVVSNAVGSRTSSNANLRVSQVVPWGAGFVNSNLVPNCGQSLLPLGMTNAVSIAAGGYHSLALRPGGKVTAWGYNYYGQTNVPTLTDAVATAAGLYHSLILRSNGTVAAWGYAPYGTVYPPATVTNVAAIAAGWSHSLALRSNGTVVAWGAGTAQSSWPNSGQSLVPTNLTGVAAVAAGGYHSLALQSNGTVVAWGWNASGQTNVPVGLSNVVAIAAGASNSLALKNDGTLVAWGDNSYGQTSIPAGLSNVVAIAAGMAHTLALQRDGTLVAWGLNGNGQASIPAGLGKVAAISAGAYHSLALVNLGPVTFLAPPYSQTVYKDSDVTLSAPALGAAPLSYQWLRNGTGLDGETNASLSRAGVQLADAGRYQLVVSNSFGTVTSAVAVLTVVDKAPFFTAQPTNQWVLLSSNVTLRASAGGLPPISYQWRLNGNNLPGATNLLLAVTNAQLAHEGNYCLVASNAYGVVTSSNAFLNVIDVPDALGLTNVAWLNASAPAWYAQSNITHDGFAAAAVGPLAYGKQTMLQTAVTGPGTLSFWWTDSLYVRLTFALDGVTKASWQQYSASSWASSTFYVPAGVHVLTWTAASQFSPSYSGMAYLDQVTFVPGPTAPLITSQPANQTNAAGNNVTFSAGVAGTPPMSYQWYFNGTVIPGATSSSLTLANIQATNIGAYNVVVTSDYGTAASSNALLTVTPAAPTITAQPTDVQVLVGGQATFSSAAVGTSPLSYQWLFNGAPIPGATASSLTLSNVLATDGGSYALAVSNALGSATSSNALLLAYTVADIGATLDGAGIAWSTTNVPWFPQTNTTHDGVSAAQSGVISGSQQSTLQGVVTGPATVTYWWKVNCDSFWVNLSFALNGTVQNAIAGSVDWQPATNYIGAGSQVLQWNLYPIHGSFAGGTAWLDQVQVIPGGTAASIAAEPVSLTNSAGNSVSFSVAALGTPPLLYQWQLNGTNLVGATNATLTLNNVQTENAGVYSVSVTNDYGSDLSSNALLVVNPSAPVITSQPVSQSRTPNSSVSFKVSARGSSPLDYQWQWNGTSMPGETNTTLSLSSLQSSHAGSYSVVVTNAYGAVTSSLALLEVNPTAVLEYWPMFSSGYATPFGLSNVIAVAAGNSHTAALRQDGTVAAWGTGTYGQTNVPAGLSNVIALAAGANHTVALKADGTVAVWGDNVYGQLLVPADLSNVIAIAAAANHTLALKADGTVVGWGNNGNGQLNIPPGLSGVVAIGAGVYNGLAVKGDGTAVQWGNGPTWQHNGTNAQLVVAAGLSNVVAAGAGGFSAWSLHNDGTVRGWGWNENNNYSGVAALSAAGTTTASYDYVLGLRYDGTLASTWFGDPFNTPYISVSPTNVIGVSAALRHAAVLVNDGSPQVVGRAPDQAVYSGATAVLPSGIVGAGPMTYQWQLNGTNLVGATNAFLVLSNVPLSAVGSYRCIAANNQGSVTNQGATLTVSRTTPWFDQGTSLSSEGYRLLLGGLSGHGPVVILSSSNLVDWVPVCTNAPTLGQLQLVDPAATNQPCLFYRAVEQ